MEFSQRCPDSKMPVSDGELRQAEATCNQIANDQQPCFFAFPLAALTCQQDLLAICRCTDNNEERRLLIFDARFDVKTVRPDVDNLRVREVPALPLFALQLPARFQPLDRRA